MSLALGLNRKLRHPRFMNLASLFLFDFLLYELTHFSQGKLIRRFRVLRNSRLTLVHSLCMARFLQQWCLTMEDRFDCPEASVLSSVLAPLSAPSWLVVSSSLSPSPSRSWAESYWTRSGLSGLSANPIVPKVTPIDMKYASVETCSRFTNRVFPLIIQSWRCCQ